jgi:hypothetical protein
MEYEDDKTVSPYKFANQFCDELIKDLKLTSDLCCPKCVITYVDGSVEGCCFYSMKETGSDDSSHSDNSDSECEESNNILNCIFDYDRFGLFGETTQKEVDHIWIDAVLKECKKIDDAFGVEHGQKSLFEKWTEIFKQVNID